VGQIFKKVYNFISWGVVQNLKTFNLGVVKVWKPPFFLGRMDGPISNKAHHKIKNLKF
jgi:hypothetical protein